jgi:HEAT repeat protein
MEGNELAEKTAAPRRSADAVLPRVEAPTASFILQLFLIPLLIVSIVVLLWLAFGWLAHAGQDNPDLLLRRLQRFDDDSWKAAKEFADLLRSPDPKYDALRSDAERARELAAVLEQDVRAGQKGEQTHPSRAKLRMFLCRALGMFHVADGLPTLVRCAGQQRDPVEAEVRLTAIEGIATLASNIGPERIQADQAAMKTLLDASRAADDDEPAPSTSQEPVIYRPHSELRAVAAYTLGVVGGQESLDRLAAMLRDPYPNARYNAATGLARQGDARCIPVLKEMLRADNVLAARDERYEADKDRKRAAVIFSGIQASLKLAEVNPQADVSPLVQALDDLAGADLNHIKTDRIRLQSAAREARRLIGIGK